MGLSRFFHKIKVGFERRFGASISRVPENKRYGNFGEDDFNSQMEALLERCKIKRNVIINTVDGNAEIDCLILYKNKLFAIEVKAIKGRILKNGGGYVQEKTDKYTGEIHRKAIKSPFKQLGRAIYLLKKQVKARVWVNGVVFFEDDDFEMIEAQDDEIWFRDVDRLINYMENGGRSSEIRAAEEFFERSIAADHIYSKNSDRTVSGTIEDCSLKLTTPRRVIQKKDIDCIYITHHWSYDELKINLKNGICDYMVKENGVIFIRDNGELKRYQLSKIDYIKIG